MGIVTSEFVALSSDLKSEVPCLCPDGNADAKDIDSDEQQNIRDDDLDDGTFLKEPNNDKTRAVIQQLLEQSRRDDIFEILDAIFRSYQSEKEITKLDEDKERIENSLDEYTKQAYIQTFENVARQKKHNERYKSNTSQVIQISNCKEIALPFVNSMHILSPHCEANQVYLYEWNVKSHNSNANYLACDDVSRHLNYKSLSFDAHAHDECLMHLQYLSMAQISSAYHKTSANCIRGKEKWCFTQEKDSHMNDECRLIAFCSYGQHRTTAYKYDASINYKSKSKQYIDLLKRTKYMNNVSYLRQYKVRAGYMRYGALAYFDGNCRIIGIQTYDGDNGAARFCAASANENNQRWKLVKFVWKSSVLIASHLTDWLAQCRFVEMNAFLQSVHENLRSSHPCRRLFEPFIYGTISANYYLSTLMQQNAIYHRALGFEYDSFCKLITDSMTGYKFKLLKKKFSRNSMNSDAIFPATRDFKVFWDIIETFVKKYIDIYYDAYDENVFDSDEELHAFYDSLSAKLKIKRKYRYKRENVEKLITHYICTVSAYNKHLNEAVSFDGLFASLLFYPQSADCLLQNYTSFAVRNYATPNYDESQNDTLSFAEYILIVLNNGAKERNFNLKNSEWQNIILNDRNSNTIKQLFNDTQNDLETLQQEIQFQNKHKRYMPYNACCVEYLQSSACL